MMPGGFTSDGLKRLQDVMEQHVARGSAPGLVWTVARHGDPATAAATAAEDTIYRIASMTKPVTAVAALILVEECRIRLDEPVDRWLPELADRRVLSNPEGPLDDTVPAERPITLRDLLTSRMGIGMDLAAFGLGRPQPVLEASADLGLGAGPPAPAGPPEPDEWMRRLGTLPLSHQPGERWLYHTSADVLGVLVARVAGQPFDAFLTERIFGPLGMVDTGFSVPPDKRHRLGPCYWQDDVYDPVDGQWSSPPAFPGGGGGLVSTAPDYFAFAAMLLAGGTLRGRRILSRPSVEAMTMNHLTPEQVAAGQAGAPHEAGWGFGVGVRLRRTGPVHCAGTYGWDGGLGTVWSNDPAEDLVGILLTNQMWTSPEPPPVCQDFWTCVYGSIDG